MQQVICVRAHGSFKPGDKSEVPDGAEVSALYWELAGTPEAVGAVNRAAEQAKARAAAEAEQEKARAAAEKDAAAASTPPKPAAPPAAAAAETPKAGA